MPAPLTDKRMKFNLNCREITHLVLEGEDRQLTRGERLRLRFHMMICEACPRFVTQLAFMRSAVGRWKRYGDEEGPPPG
jgi:hypothetical protein